MSQDWKIPKATWNERTIDFSVWLREEVPAAERVRMSIVLAEALAGINLPVDGKEALRVVSLVREKI